MQKLFLLLTVGLFWSCSLNAVDSEVFKQPRDTFNDTRLSIMSAGDTTLLPDSVQIGLILMGQSNMVGRNVGQFPPAYLVDPMPGVYIRDKFFNFTTLDYPINNNGNNFGPELALCYHLSDTLQRDLYVVKPAWDGAGLYADHLGNDYNVSTNELYPKLRDASLALKNQILSLSKTPLIIMVVVQGERDTKNATVAAQWETNFTNIINQLAIDSVTVDYIVLNTLSTNQNLNVANRTTVIAKQTSYATNHANTFLIDMTPYALNSDIIHFSGPAQVQIGKDICDIIYDQIIDP